MEKRRRKKQQLVGITGEEEKGRGALAFFFFPSQGAEMYRTRQDKTGQSYGQ
jgi:hypothetical protein